MRWFLRAGSRFVWSLTVVLVLMMPPCLRAESQSLNQTSVHAKYKDRDFLAVIRMLETFVGDHKSFSRADSIFIAKYLAVTLIANPETRERGRFFMMQFIELSP